MRYEFTAYGNTLTVPSANLLDAFAELSQAMAKANKELLWANPESKDGTWELVARETDVQRYQWVEGSYFD